MCASLKAKVGLVFRFYTYVVMSDSFYKHSLPLLCKVLMYAFYLGGREDCFEICTMLWFSEPAKCCQENQDWEM